MHAGRIKGEEVFVKKMSTMLREAGKRSTIESVGFFLTYFFMRTHGFTLVELLIVVGIIGVLVSIATFSFLQMRQKTRDTVRIQNAKTIITALESYRDSFNKLPTSDDVDNDSGWDIGNTRLPNDTFIQPLVDGKVLVSVPRETALDPAKNSFGYFRYEDGDEKCKGNYAILGVRLEGKKDSFGVKSTLEQCFIDGYPNAIPQDDYWLGYMIRE